MHDNLTMNFSFWDVCYYFCPGILKINDSILEHVELNRVFIILRLFL